MRDWHSSKQMVLNWRCADGSCGWECASLCFPLIPLSRGKATAGKVGLGVYLEFYIRILGNYQMWVSFPLLATWVGSTHKCCCSPSWRQSRPKGTLSKIAGLDKVCGFCSCFAILSQMPLTCTLLSKNTKRLPDNSSQKSWPSSCILVQILFI